MKYLYKKELYIPLYRGKFVVILTNDLEKVEKYLPKYHIDELYAHTIATGWGGIERIVMVLNFDNPGRKMYHGTIAHEAVHVAHFIAEKRGFIPSFENDEPITYLVEWIIDETYKFMSKQGMVAAI